MTVTTNPISAPTAQVWLRELAAARTAYEERLGWPVSMEVTARCLTLGAGQIVDALTVPTPLAAQAQTELEVMMLAGPVIASPDGGSWTLLTDLATDVPHVPPDLDAAGVHAARRGEWLVLPPDLTAALQEGWHWIAPPPGRLPLPPWSVVVGATRRALSRQVAGTSW
ncbi:MAG: hypothetical protein M3443_04750 [Actinomycetota bacterium]|nr:hypothetical protein [Actinomycetota bacterium]